MGQYDDTRSPQADILDEILWGRLSNFWSDFYDPSDRQALNAMYEASMKVLDAESVRLFQLADSTCVDTCPVYSQRRWVRLDLNRYAPLKAWFKYLVGGSGVNTNDDCVNPSNHARHWHLNAPWVLSTDTSQSLDVRRVIHVGYPISANLTGVYTGGLRLAPGIDYSISADGKSILLAGGVPGQVYQLDLALDLSSTYYDGTKPMVVTPIGSADGDLLLPDGVGMGQPVLVMIVRSPPPFTVDPATGAALCTASNNAAWTTDRTLVLGSTYITNNRIRLPAGYAVSPTDLVQVFGLAPGDFTVQHQHQRMSLQISSATPVSEVSADGFAAGLPAFGLVGGLGTVLHISANGKLIAPEDYRFDLPGRSISFSPPLAVGPDGVRIDIEYTVETSAASTAATSTSHLHHLCAAHSVVVVSTPDAFDDGGTYDDGGVFDSATATNVYQLKGVIDLATLEIYISGVLLATPGGYVAGVVGSGSSAVTQIVFSQNIAGLDLLFSYRSATAATVFGGTDLSSSQYAITQSALDNLSRNYVNVTTAFKQAYGVSDADLQWLVEAAYVSAAGGNPLLTLFFDEFPEYSRLPIDSPSQSLTADQTRNIESADIELIDIPFLVDRVVDPTTRLQSGVDFSVSNGSILGSPSLLASRGPDDANPGVWWVPLLVLDERLLAKNFGALVGDVRPSSVEYAAALRANLWLRYQGASLGSVKSAVCAYLGSPVFASDGFVQGYRNVQTGWSVTLANSVTGYSQAFAFSLGDKTPAVGDSFFAGQSLRGSPVYATNHLAVTSWDGSKLVVRDFLPDAAAGDVCHLHLTDPATGLPAWVVFHIASISSGEDLGGPLFVLTFKERSSLLATAPVACHIVRDFGPPYSTFDGTVQSVIAVTQKQLQLRDGTTYTVPADAPEGYGPGDKVSRGYPVLPHLATVYDDVSRPGWHWITPSQYQNSLSVNYDVYAPPTYTGNGVLTYRGLEYAILAVSPAGLAVKAGDTVLFTAPSGAVAKLQVVGPTAAYGSWYVYDTAVTGSTASVSGSFTGITPSGPDLSIEQGTGTPAWTAPSTTLQSPTLYGGAALITNTSTFPAAGRVAVVTPTGAMFECEYKQNVNGILQELNWDPSATAVALPPALPTGSVVYLTAKLRSKILHPAFLSLVQQRCTGTTVTDRNADALYGVLKASAAVVETAHVNWPTALSDLLTDTTPAKSSVILFARHVVADAIPLQGSDSAFQFQPPTLSVTVSTPASTFDPLTGFHISRLYNTATVSATTVGAGQLGALTYAWSINTVTGTGTPTFIDATGGSAAIVGLKPNERYSIKVVMSTTLGPSFSATALLSTDS